MEIALVIGLLLVAIFLFATEKFSVDVVTIGVLVILCIFGIVTPSEAFAGFSSDFMIILASIFVISAALSETGLLDIIGSQLIKRFKSPRIFVGYTMLITAVFSAFMNNTTITALVTGPVVGIARKLSVSPSKVLIPVAYASILGGTCTLIGTSTNVAVSGYIASVGMEELHFFEIFFIGLILTTVGIVFMLIFWRKLLPDYKEAGYTEEYNIKQYLSEIVIPEGSELVGQTAFTSGLAEWNVRIIKIIRGKKEIIPNSSTLLDEKDILLVECKMDDLIKVKEAVGMAVRADTMVKDEIQSDQVRLMEVLVTPGSPLINKTLKDIKFRQNYDVVVLAIHRYEGMVSQKIGNLRIKMGDVLLVQGTEEATEAIKNLPEFSVMGDFKVDLFKKRKGIFAAIVFLVAILLGSLNILPLSVSFLAAALVIVVSGAIRVERAYAIINWQLLILIGGMSALGTAMENSGASEFLANNIIHLLGDFGVMWVMAGFVVLVIILTQPMSNAAAALVVLPVAIQAAEMLQVDPRSFAIAIMLGASVSLITPFEPSCILVYGPGKYKFIDFIKAGLPLTVILTIIILLLVPVFWPL
ncbi:SLC13 family permease [Gramella sp. GC03-9]|uniref:SLC13 family permease n=1 Tax=Christiangramia oceanisediminis TaxID=2920386 RepID=A0A9X2KZ68_9FLAO|nr:SLC13 family permease [Gramella oceanisediminis]MCP9200886.1 SLC13 family permease [Gramella oceanisediminis]